MNNANVIDFKPTERAETRILIYSHDSYGLGHLRRCRTIAEALVQNHPNTTVLIVSGSEIAGSFNNVPGIDVIKIPGIIKLENGDYASRAEGVALETTLSMRRKLIAKTAQVFDPHLFIVDKEPMGLRGEVEPTLVERQLAGCKTVLGLRDVMDDPQTLQEEWDDKGLIPKTASLFDEIWIYGPRDFWNPLEGIDVPPHMAAKTHHVGFINRHRDPQSQSLNIALPDHFILVTAGGGGDGDDIMLDVLAARTAHDDLPPMVLLAGPFMPPAKRQAVHAQAQPFEDITVIDFVAEPEVLMRRADAVVGMCGYNTFCEILSYDKPALYLPRTTPRMEQWVRADRAAALGLASMISSENAADPDKMAAALRALETALPPSQTGFPLEMTGLDEIAKRTENLLSGMPA
ncbi:glycosyltransferase family protein [Pseudahrensia aquimaris]|uniref:Glycosyltransferase family protein n=1 Tax=Pseudahrensia aquimaris TaxID=744461 RepID=A0ABW3FDX3_9HYPH